MQAEFNALAADLARQYPDRARLWFAYNEPLSHLIYAGADMLLVPSMFEPCGLTQVVVACTCGKGRMRGPTPGMRSESVACGTMGGVDRADWS